MAQAIKEDTKLLKPIHANVEEIRETVDAVHDQAEQQKHQEIIDYIAPYDFSAKHSNILSRRQPGTGQWFLESPKFKSWVKDKDTILWCQGIPGSGKTTLMSITVEHLQSLSQHQYDIAVLYAFCDSGQRDIQTAESLLASLWRQLMRFGTIHVSESRALESDYVKPGVMPSVEKLVGMLRSEMAKYSKTFVLLDALDECNSDIRPALFKAIRLLQPDASLLVTSRMMIDEPLDTRRILFAEILAREEDLHIYIEERARSNRRLSQIIQRKPSLLEDIKQIVVEKAQGM